MRTTAEIIASRIALLRDSADFASVMATYFHDTGHEQLAINWDAIAQDLTEKADALSGSQS